jgi:hypothetical protein
MRFGIGFLIFLAGSLPLAAQQSVVQQTGPQMPNTAPLATGQTPQRDPQAISVIAQALNAAGGVAALSAMQNYTATGTVIYYWGGDEVKGNVTVKSRGLGQFRLDATLPEGVRSWSVNNGEGMTKQTNGDMIPIEYHNGMNFGNFTDPLLSLAADSQDPTVSIAYVGLETLDGAQVHHIHTQKVLANDQTGMFGRLTRKDFFINAATFQLISTLDMVHPKNESDVDKSHEVDFSDYQTVDGVLVPFTISEIVIGQHTFTIQLQQVTFNGSVNDSDFNLD